MNYPLLTIFLVLSNSLVRAEEITLFNPDGEAIAYIDADDEDMCIYLWNGTPVAYLEPEDEAFDIYGFNGEHLGWFEEGIVRDHDGYVVGFIEGAINVFTQFEPFKSFKKFKPHRSFLLSEICTLKANLPQSIFFYALVAVFDSGQGLKKSEPHA
jgi:hypothetical protein